MLASLRLRFVAIYFRRPPEFPKRQAKPWLQKTEPSTWPDPPVHPQRRIPNPQGANRNVAEVGRFRTEVMCGKLDGASVARPQR